MNVVILKSTWLRDVEMVVSRPQIKNAWAVGAEASPAALLGGPDAARAAKGGWTCAQSDKPTCFVSLWLLLKTANGVERSMNYNHSWYQLHVYWNFFIHPN